MRRSQSCIDFLDFVDAFQNLEELCFERRSTGFCSLYDYSEEPGTWSWSETAGREFFKATGYNFRRKDPVPGGRPEHLNEAEIKQDILSGIKKEYTLVSFMNVVYWNAKLISLFANFIVH